MEQADTDALLQPAYHLAQGRGGHTELLGRPGEVERFRDRDEGAELAEVAGGEEGITRAHELHISRSAPRYFSE